MERMKYSLGAELVPKDRPGSRLQGIDWVLEAEFLPKSTPQGRNPAHENTALEQNSSLKCVSRIVNRLNGRSGTENCTYKGLLIANPRIVSAPPNGPVEDEYASKNG